MLRIKYNLERTTKNTYCFAPVEVHTADPTKPVVFGKLWIGKEAFKQEPTSIEVTVTSEVMVPA